MGVSDPRNKVPEKTKQGSGPHFITTAVPNGEVPDMFSNFFLKGGKVPGNLPPKNEILPKSSKYEGFNLKSRNFFTSETFRFSLFSFVINFYRNDQNYCAT